MPTFINSADVSQTIIPETTFKTTPTSGATRYELPFKVDTIGLSYKRDAIKSDTKRPNRASNGQANGMGKADGTMEFRMSKAPVYDVLLASALSGTFNTGVLKAAATDSTFTHIAKLSSTMYQITPGCICNSVTFASKMGEGVSASFAVTGADRTNSATDTAITAVTSSSGPSEYTYDDVQVVVAGVAQTFTEFTAVVSHPKTARGAFGTNAVIGYGVAGNREVTVTLKAYRGDFTLDTLVNTGVPAKITITVGAAGDGFKITVPLADFLYPEDSADNGSLMQTVVATARWDDASGTDVQFERL